MKKITSMVLLAIIMLYSTSCAFSDNSSNPYTPFFENDIEWATNRSEEIITIINSGDKEAFKALFAPSVCENIPDFDEDIDELFDFIKGTNAELIKTSGISVSTESNHGRMQIKLDSWSKFNTDEGKYSFVIKYTVFDNINKNNVGLEYFIIADLTEYDPGYGYGPGFKLSLDGEPAGISYAEVHKPQKEGENTGDGSVSSDETTE